VKKRRLGKTLEDLRTSEPEADLDAFLRDHPHVRVVEQAARPVLREFKAPGPMVPREFPPGQVPYEEDEQQVFVEWVEARLPDVKFFAVPNGGKRHPKTAARLKATGVKAGVPDLVFPEPRGHYHGLYLEMKRTVGGEVSKAQREWLLLLADRGYCPMVAEGAEEAMKKLTAYLALGPFAVDTKSPKTGPNTPWSCKQEKLTHDFR
jgi:hypothetical protein